MLLLSTVHVLSIPELTPHHIALVGPLSFAVLIIRKMVNEAKLN
jgi:hypothetical protein